MDGPSPVPTSAPSKWRWPRRLLYAFGWLGCVLLCFGLLGLAALWLVAKNPVVAINTASGWVIPSAGLEVDSIESPREGLIEVRGLVLNPDEVGEALRIEKAMIEYSAGDGDIWETGRIQSLVIEGGSVELTDALLAHFAGEEESAGEAAAQNDESSAPLPEWLERVLPEEVRASDVKVVVAMEGLPRIETTVAVESETVHTLFDAKDGEHRLTLADTRWARGDGSSPLQFEQLDAAVRIGANLETITAVQSEISGLKIDLTEADLKPFLDAPTEESSNRAQLPAFAVEHFAIKDAQLGLSGFEGLPSGVATVDVALTGVHFAEGKLTSSELQKVSMREVSLFAPGAGDAALLKWSQLDVSAVPDDLISEGWVEHVAMRGAESYVNKASLGEFLEMFAAEDASPAAPEDPVPAVATTEKAPLPTFKVRDLKLEPMVISFDPEGIVAGAPAVRGVLQARSEGDAPAGDVSYLVDLTEIDVREKFGDTKGFATGKSIAAQFTAAGLQERGEIGKVTIGGIRIEVGDEVQRLVEALPASEPDVEAVESPGEAFVDEPVNDEPAAEGAVADVLPDAAEALGLSIAELEIDDTVIALKDLIPDVLPRLPISIDTKLTDVPLIGRSRGDEREQRIEIKGVQIASPYNTLQNVAELKTVWIHFTMAGLLRSEIKRIEVVSPDLYVGEPLFWYIDHVRKFSEGSGEEIAETEDAVPPPAADPEPEVAKAGEDAAEGADGDGAEDAIVQGLKNFELAGWRIGAFEAHSGRIIIAPTGVPLGIVPFPFDAKTDFAEGKVEINVGVPTGDYTFENLELEFEQLEGEAFVNYPVSAENNNFVQTFKAPRVKFMQFEAEDVWLSVTYDQNGIYGQLGGGAYDGYLNGAFNLYIEGPYKWDAWVSGEDFSLGDFTDVLAPEQFMMSGALNGKVVADGQELNVAKASATADCGKGTMHVLKLDDVRESLPEEWDPLWKALTNAGLDAFRDYHFDTGSAELQYAGKEGVARLNFDGDDGKRDLMLRLFDGDKSGQVAGRAAAAP